MTTTTTTPALADLDKQLPIKDTQEAREYLDAWHRENFPTDRTFSRYILGTQGERSKLAGDFAWQLANALARRAAQPVAPASNTPVDELWMHEDMDRDNAASALNAPRKDLKAAHTQSVEDAIHWRRRALTAEAALAAPSPQVAEGAELPRYKLVPGDTREWMVLAADGHWCKHEDAARAIAASRSAAGGDRPELTVWYGPMPESNGKSNFTAVLMRKDRPWEGEITIDRSEYPDRVRYEADRVRYLIGELDKEPWILDYDADKNSGYATTAPASAGQAAPAGKDTVKELLDAAFQALQHDAGEQDEEYRFLRKNLGDSFSRILKRAPLAAQPAEGAGQAGQVAAFPERDQSQPAEKQGLFRKFDVRRVDGSDLPGGKHHGCRYYVLDLTHDQHAPAAMRAYAAACRTTHPKLADDIEAEFGAERAAAPADILDAARYREACAEGGRIHIDWSASKEEIDARLDESLVTHQPGAQEGGEA